MLLNLLLLTACDDALIGVSSDPAPPIAVPTWYQEVLPIVGPHCQGCHIAGGIGPFPLVTYDDAFPQHAAIAAATAAGSMPPWPPAAECNTYLADLSLTSDQRAVLAAWSAGGAPAGDAASPVQGPPVGAGLTRVDLTLPLQTPYTPITEPDDYRCFLLDVASPTDVFVTGFGVDPDQDAIVHHAIAYLVLPEQLGTYQALDSEDETPGWECFGGPGGDGALPWLGAWVPGSLGNDYPEGTGIPVPTGSSVVVQMHYNTDFAPPVPDQTTIAFRYEPTVSKPAAMLRWSDPTWTGGGMPIPAGEADVVHTYRAINPLSTSGQVWAAGLHMHNIGASARLRVFHADGTETCLLDIPDWDFHWQGIYFFDTPITVGPDDEIEAECHFYASTSLLDVNWGEGSADEMCLGVVYATAD